MPITLTITTENAQEMAQQVGMLALVFSSSLQPKGPHTGPMTETVVSAEPKPRGRPKKGVTIDHDANEGGKADVRMAARGDATEAGVDDAVDAAPALADGLASNGDHQAGSDGGEGSAPAGQEKAEGAAENAGVDANAKADAQAQTLTVDEVRQFTIDKYLVACFPTQAERKDEFGSLLAKFGISKLGDLPVELISDFKAEVDKRIAAKKA